jgi:hypothetical protein
MCTSRITPTQTDTVKDQAWNSRSSRCIDERQTSVVILSKFHTDTVKDQAWNNKSSRCTDGRQTLVVLLSKLQMDMVKDQVWISSSSRWRESNILKIPSNKHPWWTKELPKHTNFLAVWKFLPLQHNLTKSRSHNNNLESEKKTHDKTLNARALRRLRRAFLPNHKRRTWDRRPLKKKKKTVHCHRKKRGNGDKKRTSFF